jgi:hypothetical protein
MMFVISLPPYFKFWFPQMAYLILSVIAVSNPGANGDYSLISQKVVWEIHIGEPLNTRCPKLFGGSSIYLQEGYGNIRSTIKTYSVM